MMEAKEAAFQRQDKEHEGLAQQGIDHSLQSEALTEQRRRSTRRHVQRTLYMFQALRTLTSGQLVPLHHYPLHRMRHYSILCLAVDLRLLLTAIGTSRRPQPAWEAT